MPDFFIHFFICNIFIGIITGLTAAAKHLLRRQLSPRLHYNLWYILLGLLPLPFLPFGPSDFLQVFWGASLPGKSSEFVSDTLGQAAASNTHGTALNWMNDFAFSVSQETPTFLDWLLMAFWSTGVAVMVIFALKSRLRLSRLEKSALPLQSKEVHEIFEGCLKEMKLDKKIPVYSTAFLQSPVMIGYRNPGIYLPIHLISDLNAADMRFMFLHELQHYKHRDGLSNYLMNLAVIVYWFNPMIWYAVHEMRNDRETACDSSVLGMLSEYDYYDYGRTLINFAEKISLSPFPFSSGMGGSMRQMKRRILNIACYRPESLGRKIKGLTCFSLIAVILLCLSPILSIHASMQEQYQYLENKENISYIDLSSDFRGYDGSFVLYDMNSDAWQIYNKDYAALRVSPNSTYKIFDAMLGLESEIISPELSQMVWNGETYPFEAWNRDQNLCSAMSASVTWYFQNIDKQLGLSEVKTFFKRIGYGNEDISGGLSSYWMESSLKISPVEQVLLLKKMYLNEFGFTSENVAAVKESIFIESGPEGSLYGKTGTGRVNGSDINGWFTGFIEQNNHVFFFATNIQGDEAANGSTAADISLKLLLQLGLWDS